jgi:integrase
LNVARKKLADGSIREYFYDRNTGENLGTDRAIAQARIDERATSQPVGPTSTLGHLIAEYQRTDAFRSKAPRTREIYSLYLGQLRERFGTLRVTDIATPQWVERLKLDLQDTPSKANQTLAVLRIVFKLGMTLGYCASNPATLVRKVREVARSDVWTPAQIETFAGAARGSLRLAMALMIYTAQRPSDVLAMTKGQITERDGRLYIGLRQEKTGTLLDVPVHSDLAPLLRARLADPSGGLLLVASPTGLPWSRRNFSRAWDLTRRRAGLPELQRRDLRRTAVVQMALTGVTTPQIASITGHSIDATARILATYLPRRTDVALAGMEAWERGAGGPASNVVVLQTGRRASR